MSDLTNELRQYALMCANEVRRLNLDKSDEVEKAFDRVRTFGGSFCPSCWVKDGKAFELEIKASTNEAKYYKCSQCDFNGTFPTNG